MKRSIVLGFAALLVLAACSSDSNSSATTTTTTTSSSSSAASSSSSSSAASGVVLDVATNAKLGQLLVDGAGKTVYMYEPDGTSATSTVPAGITSNWPPVMVSGTPKVGAGLDASKAGGTTQLSYNGHLLYTFVGDTAAGTANGQGLGSVWFAVSPSGEKIPRVAIAACCAAVKHASSSTLDDLEPLLVTIRALPGLKEKNRGTFYRGSKAFLHFHEDPAGIFADVRFVAGGDFERCRATTKKEQADVVRRVKAVLS